MNGWSTLVMSRINRVDMKPSHILQPAADIRKIQDASVSMRVGFKHKIPNSDKSQHLHRRTVKWCARTRQKREKICSSAHCRWKTDGICKSISTTSYFCDAFNAAARVVGEYGCATAIRSSHRGTSTTAAGGATAESAFGEVTCSGVPEFEAALVKAASAAPALAAGAELSRLLCDGCTANMGAVVGLAGDDTSVMLVRSFARCISSAALCP